MKSFLASLAITAVLLPAVIWFMGRVGSVDIPNVRSSHTCPTPRGAGVALVLGAGIASYYTSSGGSVSEVLVFGIFSAVVAGLGLIDDLVGGLGIQTRFVVASLAAAAVTLYFARRLPGGPVLGGVACLFWLVGFVNVFNFMDGANGMSALSGVAISATLWHIAPAQGAVATVAASCCGACIAFLPFNVPVAQAFLGDVGSYALGGVLGILAVGLVAQGRPVVIVVLPFLPYLADTSLTLIGRIANGERFYDAHRQHAYQLLIDGGWSHARVSCFISGVTVICGVLSSVAVGGSLFRRWLFFSAAVALSVASARAPRAVVWYSARRRQRGAP